MTRILLVCVPLLALLHSAGCCSWESAIRSTHSFCGGSTNLALLLQHHNSRQHRKHTCEHSASCLLSHPNMPATSRTHTMQPAQSATMLDPHTACIPCCRVQLATTDTNNPLAPPQPPMHAPTHALTCRQALPCHAPHTPSKSHRGPPPWSSPHGSLPSARVAPCTLPSCPSCSRLMLSEMLITFTTLECWG